MIRGGDNGMTAVSVLIWLRQRKGIGRHGERRLCCAAPEQILDLVICRKSNSLNSRVPHHLFSLLASAFDHRHDLDLDEEPGVGQRCHPDKRARRGPMGVPGDGKVGFKHNFHELRHIDGIHASEHDVIPVDARFLKLEGKCVQWLYIVREGRRDEAVGPLSSAGWCPAMNIAVSLVFHFQYSRKIRMFE